MMVLKCTVCGGNLRPNTDYSVGICPFCASMILVPKNLDRKGNLYNRAVFLRQNNEFDSAVSVYEDLLKEDNTDAEAHWGLVLSKFGIEYVLDPKTNERMPTCHRMQTVSVLADPDYKAALDYSDQKSRSVIEKEAKRISQIQAGFLEVCRNEPPYDVFICYKETDDAGRRTEDSVLAQDLYFELTKKGYQTFFARKTLENKIGKEYEPIIFAALSSAKIMVVLGTKPEYFNAVWVRNEWGRFLKMSNGRDKVLIPAYRGMSPYELPESLTSFQALDMSRIGFFQDLIDAIDKILKKDQQSSVISNESVSQVSAVYGIMPLDRYLKNAGTFLMLKNYDESFNTYMKVTEFYPDDYRGWWGLIASKTQNFTDFWTTDASLNDCIKWGEYTKQLVPVSDSDKVSEIDEVCMILSCWKNIRAAFSSPNEFDANIFSKIVSSNDADARNKIDAAILSSVSEYPVIPSVISAEHYPKVANEWKQFIVANKLLLPCISDSLYNIKRSRVSKMVNYLQAISKFYSSQAFLSIPVSVRNHRVFEDDRNYFWNARVYFQSILKSMPVNYAETGSKNNQSGVTASSSHSSVKTAGTAGSSHKPAGDNSWVTILVILIFLFYLFVLICL